MPPLFTQVMQLSVRLGEDVRLPLALNPHRDVTGFTVVFRAQSRGTVFVFPPLTIAPQDPLSIWVPSLTPGVIPGVQPPLPVSGGTTVLVKSGSGLTTTDAANGIFSLNLLSADTAALSPDLYTWQLTRTDPGHETVLLSGTLALLPVS